MFKRISKPDGVANFFIFSRGNNLKGAWKPKASPQRIMENQYGFSYEVRFDTTDYMYITGNAAFYDFRGEKLYTKFDSLLPKYSLKILNEKIKSGYFGKPFCMDILTQENTPCEMVCILENINVPNQVTLHHIELEKLSDRFFDLSMKQRIANSLLSQFDSVYFSYDRASDIITCYRYNEKGSYALYSSSLDDWQEQASQAITDISQEALQKFNSNLRNGIRSFAGALTNKGCEENIRFVGTAIYNDDIHAKTVGNIGSCNIKPAQELTHSDQLTGLILKEDITNYGKKLINDLKTRTALAIVDIDDFKNINDQFGHSIGDAVLKKCAAIFMGQVNDTGKVGRIGGDEFFVVFDNFNDRDEIKNVLRGIKNNVAQAYTDEEDGFHVSTSIGVAIFPDDTDNFNTLFDLADHMLYRAKHKGKNRYIMYEREKHGTVEEVLRSGINEIGISGRRGLSKSEAVCRIVDLYQCGKVYPLENILSDVRQYFLVERIVIYDKTDRTVVFQSGTELLSSDLIYETIDYLYDDELKYFYSDGVMVMNNIKMFETKSELLYGKVESQNVHSLMHREIIGKSGKTFVISYEILSSFITWNMEDMYLYRILDNIISKLL